MDRVLLRDSNIFLFLYYSSSSDESTKGNRNNKSKKDNSRKKSDSTKKSSTSDKSGKGKEGIKDKLQEYLAKAKERKKKGGK